MKVILTIGSSQWLCKSSTAAAKIADLLGAQTPIKQIYDAGRDPQLFLAKPDYSHETKIEQLVERKMLVTGSDAKVKEMVSAHRKTEKP